MPHIKGYSNYDERNPVLKYFNKWMDLHDNRNGICSVNVSEDGSEGYWHLFHFKNFISVYLQILLSDVVWYHWWHIKFSFISISLHLVKIFCLISPACQMLLLWQFEWMTIGTYIIWRPWKNNKYELTIILFESHHVFQHCECSQNSRDPTATIFSNGAIWSGKTYQIATKLWK